MKIRINGSDYEGTCTQRGQDFLLALDRPPETAEGDALTVELFGSGNETPDCVIGQRTACGISGNTLTAKNTAPETDEQIALAVLGDHEYRLCLLELGLPPQA